MDKGRGQIRKYTWVLLVLWILATLILIGASFVLGTFGEFTSGWVFYITEIVIILSLIGLFSYKKWGFYLFSVYVAYLLVNNIFYFNLLNLLVFLGLYGYIIWYKGFYKNLSSFE